MEDTSESIGGDFLDLQRLQYRVIVIKFGVDNRGGEGTGCFRIKVRTNTADY